MCLLACLLGTICGSLAPECAPRSIAQVLPNTTFMRVSGRRNDSHKVVAPSPARGVNFGWRYGSRETHAKASEHRTRRPMATARCELRSPRALTHAQLRRWQPVCRPGALESLLLTRRGTGGMSVATEMAARSMADETRASNEGCRTQRKNIADK